LGSGPTFCRGKQSRIRPRWRPSSSRSGCRASGLEIRKFSPPNSRSHKGNLLGYKRQAKLGVLGTSSLVNGFRWGLIEAGYDEALARELSRELALKLSGTK